VLKRRAILASWEESKSKYPGLVRDVSLEPENGKPRRE
jgi:hypothetical protein